MKKEVKVINASYKTTPCFKIQNKGNKNYGAGFSLKQIEDR